MARKLFANVSPHDERLAPRFDVAHGAFSSRSFDCFDPHTDAGRLGYSAARFRTLDVRYDAEGKRRWFFDRLALRVINRHYRLYEDRFLYWYPVQNIYFLLQVEK